MSFSNISSQSLAHHVYSFSRIYVTSRTKRGFNFDEIQFFLIFSLLRLIFLVLCPRPLPSPRRGAFSMLFLIFLHLRVDLWTVWINHLSALKLFLLCYDCDFFPSTICYTNFLFTTPQFKPLQQINCPGRQLQLNGKEFAPKPRVLSSTLRRKLVTSVDPFLDFLSCPLICVPPLPALHALPYQCFI